MITCSVDGAHRLPPGEGMPSALSHGGFAVAMFPLRAP